MVSNALYCSWVRARAHTKNSCTRGKIPEHGKVKVEDQCKFKASLGCSRKHYLKATWKKNAYVVAKTHDDPSIGRMKQKGSQFEATLY